MKVLFTVLLVLGLAYGISLASEDYSYETIEGYDNVGKITTTEVETTVKSDNTTIEALDEQIASIKRRKAERKTAYNAGIIQDNAEIAVLEAHKTALKVLGLKELEVEVIK